MKIILPLLLVSTISVAQLRPAPTPIQPIRRPIPVKHEYKNIVQRELAKDAKYSAITFLTHPDLKNQFDVSTLNQNSQKFYQILRADILKNRNQFNTTNLVNFLKSLGSDTAHVDLEELIQEILMEISKQESEDLKNTIEEMQKTNEAKKVLREKMKQTKKHFDDCHIRVCREGLTKEELKANADRLKQQLDSLSEMSELETLRLQQAMDRKSKLEQMLSNILKAYSETASSVIGNLK